VRARACVVVPCVLAHDGCKVRDVRHGRYVPPSARPVRALRPFCFARSCHKSHHPLPPCSRMAIDDRRFRRVGSRAPKSTGLIGRRMGSHTTSLLEERCCDISLPCWPSCFCIRFLYDPCHALCPRPRACSDLNTCPPNQQPEPVPDSRGIVRPAPVKLTLLRIFGFSC
jgi:hypothetical protein